jgi:2-furoyl-CoA dehydrogenase large subunit
VWRLLLDADTLAANIPGCRSVVKLSDTHFTADVVLGVGPVKGLFKAEVMLSDLVPHRSARLSGLARGALGTAAGEGTVTLEPDGQGATILRYDYEAEVGGKVASVGGRLLDGAARIVIGEFIASLGRRAAGQTGFPTSGLSGWIDWLRSLFGWAR